MSTAAPKIGFDRFIHSDWATMALRVRAGQAQLDDITALLEAAGLSLAAIKKTRTVLNRLWLDPRSELADFVSRGVAIFESGNNVPLTPLHWGVAIASYPFFGKVAELVGRLSSLQGDCTASEVHRRMSEVYGEREGTYRMTNMVLQSQANWGAIERKEKDKRLVRLPVMKITDDSTAAWLIEAALRYLGKAVPVASLQSLAVLYPFLLDRPLAYTASNSERLELRSEGSGMQMIALRNHNV